MSGVIKIIDENNTTTEIDGKTYGVGYVGGWFFTWLHEGKKLTRKQIAEIVDTLEEDSEDMQDERPCSYGAAERKLRSILAKRNREIR